MPSFDVVSEVDLQEVRNAVDQAHRELATRFDFKGTDSTVELKDNAIELESASEERLKAVDAGARGEAGQAQGVAEGARLRQGRGGVARARARQTVDAARRHQRRQGPRDRQVHQGPRPEGRAAPGAGRPAPRDRQEARRPAGGDRRRCASTTSASRSSSRTSATELATPTPPTCVGSVVACWWRRRAMRSAVGGCVGTGSRSSTLRPVSGLMM